MREFVFHGKTVNRRNRKRFEMSRGVPGLSGPKLKFCGRETERITEEDSRERGFTLFEVVMAIVILGVVGLPLALVFANASWRSGDGYLISTATFLAQEKAEQIMADRSSPGRGFDFIISSNYPAESPVSGYPGFSRSVTIASDSTYSSVTYRTVTVTVTNASVSDVTTTLWVTDY